MARLRRASHLPRAPVPAWPARAPLKVVGARLYERWLLPGAQVAAAAPQCGLQARLARPARERCPLACAGVTSSGEGGQSEAALQLPWSTGALRHRRGGARSTAPSNLLGSFGSRSGRGATDSADSLPSVPVCTVSYFRFISNKDSVSVIQTLILCLRSLYGPCPLGKAGLAGFAG